MYFTQQVGLVSTNRAIYMLEECLPRCVCVCVCVVCVCVCVCCVCLATEDRGGGRSHVPVVLKSLARDASLAQSIALRSTATVSAVLME